VATKLDATTDKTRLEELREFCRQRNLEFHAISAATGDGVKELVRAIADALDKIPRPSLEVVRDAQLEPGEMAVEQSAAPESVSPPGNEDL
jgi:50S ribosomal subunit-associated GTPase HflX